jgi:cytoskeletal protein CcmA (bactofilin family)
MRYLLVSIFFFFLPITLFAKGGSIQADVILVEEGGSFHGDYFAAGSSVEIAGDIYGDAYIAAGQIIVDGTIHGDLLILCGGADITGHVTGSVRLLGGQANISGKIDKNVTVVAGNVQLTPSGHIGGNIVVAAGNADLSGVVNHDAKLLCFNMRYSSRVDGNVSAYAGEVKVTSKGYIGGSFSYRSNDPATIDDRATIKGGVVYHPSIIHNLTELPWLKGIIIGSKILAALMNFLFTMAFGWILIRLFPSKLSKTIDVLNKKPLSCVFAGLVMLVVLPILCVLLLITVLGAPFALALLALNILGFYTAKIFVILWLTSKGLHMMHMHWGKLVCLALGLLLYYAVSAIPFIGFIITVAFVLLGVGAIVLAQAEKHVYLPTPKG